MKTLNDYIQDKQTICFKEHGVFFAFSNKQFDAAKKDGVMYVDLGAGLLCPKENVKTFVTAHSDIVDAGIAEDIADNGKAGIIMRELNNHECFYTGDYGDCMPALKDYGITAQEVWVEFMGRA